MSIFKRYFNEFSNTPISQHAKFIGPGLIVTIGFVDPGNWATNMSAGSEYGYSLLWVVLVSTVILMFLQYNSSKLGIVSSMCLAEATTKYFSSITSKIILSSAMLAVIATLLAELLGGAIALNILFGLPIEVGAFIVAILVGYLVFTSRYKRIESIIIAFVSLIGICFVLELFVAPVVWSDAVVGFAIPTIPQGALFVIVGMIGAVVMPHNLFLHSEFVQSKKLNKGYTNAEINQHLKYARTDTIFSMVAGFLINSAMIILAASTFYVAGVVVTSLEQAPIMLEPLLGQTASGVFSLALLAAGVASSITAAMAAGVVSSGMVSENYNNNDRHTTIGILIAIFCALVLIFFVDDAYQVLVLSQVLLSMQLPITIITQLKITSSSEIMGEYKNNLKNKLVLWICALFVIVLNLLLLMQTFL